MLMAEMLFKWFFLALIQMSQINSPGSGRVIMDNRAKAPANHPFFLAVTEINHNAADKSLEISCKMFADDLEQILEKNNKTSLDISSDKDKASFDKLIAAYIPAHLSISVDGKTIPLTYVGFEKEKESAFCYFQADLASVPKKLEINNSILYDFNESQSNIIHITVNGKRQSTRLNYPDKKAEFKF
jgi:hypothetical protein